MNLLAIECSTEMLSVAAWASGEVCEHVVDAGVRHGDRLLPLIDAVLAEARLDRMDLHGVAFGCGPGAFTGVRMAVAAAQGIAYGLDIPALPVSSLAALAQQGYERGAVAPILALADARMGEVYAGGFEVDAEGLVYAIADERLVAPGELDLPGDNVWCAVGPGERAYRELLRERFGYRLDRVDAAVYPQAASIARLGARALRAGQGVPAHLALPVYLRDKVALTEAERRRV